jgi:rhamnogalacturonan endolyase
MGWGIECGMWYSPFIAYDFNGDGKAEVVVKEAEDKRDKDGRVYEGEEYLVVLDGMTGKEIARAPWPSREDFEN